MYKIYNKAISIILALSILSSNNLWALAPEDKLDELKYAKVLVNLFQVLSGPKGKDVSLPQNLALSLDPKDRVLYLYSKNPHSRPGVIYRMYISGKTPPAVSSKPIHIEDIGKLRIEVYTRTSEWDRRIGAEGLTELTDAERTTIQEFVDSADNSLLRDVLERLLPLKGSILEINARAWGKRFKDISEADLRILKEKGYDTIWMMGIWKTSPKSAEINKGVGSAYAIMDYVINPDLGTEDEFIEFSKRAKGLGLRVVVDFIPNHMAMDSPWIDEHPEWFMPWWDPVGEHNLGKRSAKGSPYFYRHSSGRFIAHGSQAWESNEPWVDAAQLNLTNAELRQHLITTLKQIARLTQAGGVRCDMAMLATKAHIKGMWFGFTSQDEFDRLMPQEFWIEVINEVRKEYPDFKFIAETYWEREGDLQKMGFDATYDGHFYNCLKEGRIGELKDYIRRAPKDYLNRAVHYLANHDERNPLEVFGSLLRYRAASVIQGIMPGRLLYYLDQVEGKTELSSATHLPRGVKRNAGIARFYSKLIPVLSLPIFRQGSFELIDVNGEGTQNVFASKRTYVDQRAVAVVNYSNQSLQARLELGPDGIEEGNSYLLEDLVSGKKVLVKAGEIRQYELDIEPWGYHIFTITDRGKIEDESSVASARAPPEMRFRGATNKIDEDVDGRIVKVLKYKGSDVVFCSLREPNVTPENVAELITHEQERFVEAYDASVETLEMIVDTAGLRDAVLAGIAEEKMNAEFIFIKVIDKRLTDAKDERAVEFLNRLKSKVIDHLAHEWSLWFEGDSEETVRKRVGIEIGKFVRVINRLIQRQADMQRSYSDPELRSRIGSVISQLKELRKEISIDIKRDKKVAIYLLYKKTKGYEEFIPTMAPSNIREGLEEMLRVNIMVIEELRMESLIRPGMLAERRTRIKQGEIDRFRLILAEVRKGFDDRDIISFLDRLEEEVPRIVMEQELSAGLAIFNIFETLSISGARRGKISKAVNMLVGKMYEREKDIITARVKDGRVILVYEGLPLTHELEKLLEQYEDRVVAIVCDVGTGLSHFNLIAKGEGIVSLTAVEDSRGEGCFKNVKEGDLMLVYGDTGEIVVNPRPTTYFNFVQRALERRVFQEYCRRKTMDPVEMDIMVNADNPRQVKRAHDFGASGVGLVRTEYLYGWGMPEEDELIKVFRRFAQETSNKVTIRIFDRQPDKITRGLAENGVYGFEYYFTKEGGEAVRSELRAALIAAKEYPNIRIMFPLVNDEDDARMAINLVNSVRDELIGKGLITREQAYGVKIGFMVETVAAVENIWKLLEKADFVSLGTNDLTKSVFGLDNRDDPSNADKFNRLQPAVLRMVARAVKAVMDFNSGLLVENHKEISICGDLASMHEFAPFVLALGYKYPHIQLVPSVPYKSIPVIKEFMRRLDAQQCYQLFMPIIDNGKPVSGDLHEEARGLIEEVLDEIKDDEQYKDLQRAADEQLERELEGLGQLHSRGDLIGKVVDESGQIITEYITGEIQGDYLLLWDTRTHEKKLIARIRCKREFVKEDMISELTRLLSESRIPKDSIERRYIEAIIEYSAGTEVSFYVLQEDVKNIYGFANENIFCLYEPFLIIPAAFFHEAGESFFRSDVYRRFLENEIGHEIDWQRYSGKARVVVDGKERLIPAHTYLRGLGKKAREKERKPADAERLLPKRKGLEDLLFGKENLAVSQMIREQKRITQALAEFGEEKWVKELVQELKGYKGFFPGKYDKEIILFLEGVIKIESVSKLLDLCLNQLLRPNTKKPNVDLTVYEWFTEIEGLLAVLSRHIPFRRVKRILMPTLRIVRKVVRSRDKEGNLERFRRDPFIMKALVRFFNRIEKAELHHHLDGAISPQLILNILCIFPEAREKFVRDILKEQEGSVNEVFSRVVGGPKTEDGWERLRETGESGFIEAFGGIAEYNKALKAIKRYLEYRPIEKGTVNIFEFLKKFMLTGIVLYCNPEALRIIAREATLETYRRDNTTLIEQKMHNLTFGFPLITVVHKVLMGFREAESATNGKLKTNLIMCVFKNPELVLGDKYKEVAAASQMDNRSIEEIRFSIWEEAALMLQNDYADDIALLKRYLEQEKEELDSAITELRRMVNRKMPGLDSETREKEVKKRLLIFWEERKEGIRQVREIIVVKKQLALNYPDLARRLAGIDTVGSEVDYVTWVHSYSLRLAKRYGFRITDHAGESWPEEDIWQALNRVKGAVESGVVERIGHATALGIHPEMLRETKKGGRFIYTLEELRDIDRLQKEILRTIAEKGIVIETNPSSNLLLLPKYITSYSKHPVHYFWKRLRKRLVVSSDDPHILHTIGLNGEYAKISLAHPNFKFGELLQIIRSSFSNASKPVTEAISRPLWDGVLPEGGDEDLSRYHPLSIINRVRDWDKRLPVLDYQKVGEYPKRLIELEQALTLCAAGWEKARDASYGTLVTPAGMPAVNLMVDSAIERKGLGSRSEIIVIEPPYGCTKNLFERWQRMGFLVHSVSADEIKEKLPGLINSKTAVIYLESVTNPNLMMPDIEYVVKINRARAAVLVDDTFATTEMAKTLELGVDMVMLGLTKGMTGTGNIISGAVTAKKEWLSLLARNRNGIPEDKEISRAIRGLRHLEVRFKAQSRNAKRVVGRIRRGRHVTSAVYPRNGHMTYHVFKGYRNAQDFIDLLAKFRTVINAVSLGQVRNLFERASGGTHITVSKADQEKGRISPAGIRGSIGIEDIHDVLREIDAMLKIISIYGGYTMPREDLDDFQKIFMSEYLIREGDKRKIGYLLPKWPVVRVDFEKLISDLPDTEKNRLIAKYDTDKRFKKAVDIIINATEITQYDPVTIAIHHRLLWCLLSGNHNAVIGSPDESTTTHKETDQHMMDTFASILMGVKKGMPPIGNYTLYSRLGKPGICTFELLMTLLEVGIQKALDYEYIGTSFYTERMAYSAFLGQQAEIIMINEMMNVIQRKENVELRNTLLDIARRETGDPEVDFHYTDVYYGALTEEHLRGAGSREILPRLLEDVRLKDPVAYNRFQAEVRARIQKRGLEILIITPKDSVLYKEAKRIEQTDIVKFRYIHPEDIDSLKEEISRKTLLVYFDNLRIRDYDPAKIRDIVKGKNPRCMFGITDSFNLGYSNPRAERDFDFITHVVYYEKSDKGAVVIARNDKELLHVWNNPFWSRKNRGTATSEDNAFDMIWYILPYLRVFDERYDENLEAVTKLLSDLVTVKRVDKRHLEIRFKDGADMQRFLSIAIKSKLIDVSISSQDEYFSINEWTFLRQKDSKSLILRIGVEETADLVSEFKAMVNKFKKRDTDAIGKASCLEEKDSVPVEDMDDREKAVIREAIDRIKELVAKAELTDAERHQAGEALALLEEYFRAGNIKVFDARVKGYEDYLLAFPRERDHIIALARDLLDPDYIIQFYHILPEILFHEGFAARFGERDYEEHRSIYQGIQRKIFGEDNEVAGVLRFYITLKLQGDYEIEFDQRTTKDKNINLDKITSLLRNREFLYRTLKRLYGEYEFMLPYIKIGRIKVEHGGTGSRKQTLHVSFNDENTGFKMEFALKVAIHRAAREGFAKGVKDEITALRELSDKCKIPKFGIYIEEPAHNFYVYTERWINGPTAARLIARKRLTKQKLTNIVKAYLSIMKALDSRSRTGGYLGIYDVQTENVMFESWSDDNAITVDIGKIDYVKPLFILQEFDRHYSRGDPELHEAIFDGVMEIFGIEKGLKFLEEALDDSVADRRKVKGFTEEMTKGLVDSLRGYVKAVYTKTITIELGNRLEKLAFAVLDRLVNKEDPNPLLTEFTQWLEGVHKDAADAYTNDMSLSNKIRLDIIEGISESVLVLRDLSRMSPNLELVEKLLDVSFDLEPDRPVDKQMRLNVLYPARDTLDSLNLSPEDVFLSVGAGTGIYNIAACLRGVKRSIYVDISEKNLPFIVRLKKYYEDIKSSPELRNRLENKAINDVIAYIWGIMHLKGETVKLPELITMEQLTENPNLWFGEVDLPGGVIDNPNPPLDIHTADAADMPLPDDSVTKVSVVGLFRWVHSQGGKGKVIRAIKEIFRVTRPGGLILYRVHNPIESEFIDLFPKVASAMGIVVRLKEITKLGEQIFEVVSKEGDLYSAVVNVINREMGLSLSSEELRKTTTGDLTEAFRRDNGIIDKEDLRMAERIARIIDGFNISNETKLELTQGLIILIRQDNLRERIKQQIAQYDTLRVRLRHDEKKVRNVLIDKECLPRNQQYILEEDEWGRRRQLLERMFPGYRFGVFSGNLEEGMNKDNTIVLTNNKIDIDARLVSIKNAGREEYFPIDGLIFLGVGLLNLSYEDRTGSPLVSTVTKLYRDITGQDIDIQEFLKNYKLDIILPPIGRFNTELESYAISLLEQAA